ncbi:MCP methyltransferase, CheR-type [Malonomonas rubra DSM 5091]|uniref:MCP methyltransferase, CheR-type n=1 Tax=Malonomonas rubra DSM 5091 TaxID=1122189 RepID=A0A1M6JXN2_MALRU|nr:protein-glutamate O-methyltransferase CheR [Malonomonas rubra]SHJ51422.1 MCP methyltransferase, CheR-type [Malonomonas rubra DSM 5091]
MTTSAEEHKSPFVGGDVPDEAYRQISEVLREQQNFILDGYKDLCIKRRIAARIRAVGESCAEGYVEKLAASEKEQRQLLTALSIHVSHFFRNPSTFRMLEKKVLPELLRRAVQQKSKLRIWSVGCANGEEPYSLALLCKKMKIEAEQMSIIATDLSPEALQRAKRGCYEANRLRELSEEQLESFFTVRQQQYCLHEEIRRLVRFFRHDILSDQPFYRADLILCRNVLIYFSREQQQRILQILAAALPEGGYLVLGRAETLVSSCRELFRCIDPAERVYQRLKKEEQLLPTSLVQQLQNF